MDTTLAATVLGQATTWKGDAITQFGAVLPIALGLVISVSLVFFMIRTFRSVVHI